MALVTSLIVFLLVTSASECAEQTKCENTRENHYVCSGFDFSGLPGEGRLSVTVHTGNLQTLKEITPKPSVFILEIQNSLNAVEPNAFKGLTGLDVLVLEKNVLPVVEAGSLGDLHLNSLVLNGDQINEIKADAFKGSKLDLLRLSDNNNLKEIRKGVFNNLDLKQLDLFTNGISSIEDGALEGLPNLYTLKLENNALTDFQPKKIFGEAPNLQILHLQHNQLPTLNGNMLEGLRNLSTLLLGFNQIPAVEPGTFNLPNLRKLDLGNNKIRKLDSSVLSGDGLKNLWELYLHNNELTFLPTEFLKQFPHLQKISLEGNPWQCDCLDSMLKWLQENLPGVFQERKPACIDTKAKCNHDFFLSETDVENFKKQHAKNFEVYN